MYLQLAFVTFCHSAKVIGMAALTSATSLHETLYRGSIELPEHCISAPAAQSAFQGQRPSRGRKKGAKVEEIYHILHYRNIRPA